MDSDISGWILEFLLRQPIPDSIIEEVMKSLPPNDNNIRLKKAILLRSIESQISEANVSEVVLSLLEMIEEIDFSQGCQILDSMKLAYCGVAVECTVKYLLGSGNNKGKYLDAVQRIWRERLKRMEESGLFSDELRMWSDRIEAAIWDSKTCDEILTRNTRNEALRQLRMYLDEAWAQISPSSLELVAEKMNDNRLADGGERRVVPVGSKDIGGSGDAIAIEDDGNSPVNDQPHEDHNARRDRGTRKANWPTKRKHVASHRRSRGRVKITEYKEMDTGASSKEYDKIPTPEFHRVKEGLTTSYNELCAVVKDPLPEALQMAGDVVSELTKRNANEKDVDVPADGGREVPIVSADEDTLQNEANVVDQSHAHQNNTSRHSLMERNNTAKTYEWNDSIDGSSEGPSKAVEPLKKYEMTKFTRRRKNKRWSSLEEDTLRTGVSKFGKGHWKLILDAYRDIFEERTDVDLKDKWRNMTK